MPIAQILLTDTFDQWVQKDNSMIDVVNTLAASGSVLSTSSPSAGQILVYNGSTFANVTASGDITIDQFGNVTVTGGGIGTTKGRMRFAGSITSLY
jgi:hypothetical protein